jgi:hypothetical protein
MRRLLSLVALLLVACGGKSEPSPTTLPPVDAGTGSGSGIQGTLVVHSDAWDLVTDPADVHGIHVILGDGSRYRQPLGRDGVARFEDAALQGPQDVSVVLAGHTGKTLVDTFLAVDRAEVWLPNGVASAQEPTVVKQATVTGRVTGAQGTGSVDLYVVGEGFSGQTRPQADGSFSLDIDGVAPGRVHLVAHQNSPTPGAPLERVGLVRDLDVGGGQTVSGVELSMEHALDQPVPVAVEGWQPYGQRVLVRVAYFLGTQYLFGTTVAGTPPVTVPGIARTGPFENVRMQVSTTSGAASNLPSGSAGATVEARDAASVTVTLPAPCVLTSVPLGPEEAPAEAPLEGLTLRWSVAPTAHLAQVRLRPPDDALQWTVTAPATRTSFTPFALPADVALTRRLVPGRYQVSLDARVVGEGLGYADHFSPDGVAPSITGTWRTSLDGYVLLQP